VNEFGNNVERHRRRLLVHCYRMLGSLPDELFVMNADGSGQRPLTDNQWEDATPAWAPVSLR
jgi:Tol biopolymer transport system component